MALDGFPAAHRLLPRPATPAGWPTRAGTGPLHLSQHRRVPSGPTNEVSSSELAPAAGCYPVTAPMGKHLCKSMLIKNTIQWIIQVHVFKHPSASMLLGKGLIFSLELSQKSDFQPLTTKSDNIDHPTVKTRQIWPLEWFWRWFYIF